MKRETEEREKKPVCRSTDELFDEFDRTGIYLKWIKKILTSFFVIH